VSAACLALAACSVVRDAPPSQPTDVVPSPASVPAPTGVPTRAERIVASAEAQLGAPYRFGGSSPDGFDCSGLVRYVHGLAGVTVPRTAAGQMLAARAVAREDLQPGDLVFFASRGRGGPIDHVGIYVGDDSLVHAPRSGRPVSRDRLSERWFTERFAGAGRFR
jgi:murein DD-endopeptidase